MHHPCRAVSENDYIDEKKVDLLEDTLLLLQLQVILTVDIGESPLARNNNLLAARELVAGATKGFLDNWGIRVFAANGEDDLADVDSGIGSVGLAPCATHTSL